jgi:hypothetical protein
MSSRRRERSEVTAKLPEHFEAGMDADRIHPQAATWSGDATYLMDHPDSAEDIPILDVGPFWAGANGTPEPVAKHV